MSETPGPPEQETTHNAAPSGGIFGSKLSPEEVQQIKWMLLYLLAVGVGITVIGLIVGAFVTYVL
jgi:hypothetical protein